VVETYPQPRITKSPSKQPQQATHFTTRMSAFPIQKLKLPHLTPRYQNKEKSSSHVTHSHHRNRPRIINLTHTQNRARPPYQKCRKSSYSNRETAGVIIIFPVIAYTVLASSKEEFFEKCHGDPYYGPVAD
jgi:hypothetical protein